MFRGNRAASQGNHGNDHYETKIDNINSISVILCLFHLRKMKTFKVRTRRSGLSDSTTLGTIVLDKLI